MVHGFRSCWAYDKAEYHDGECVVVNGKERESEEDPISSRLACVCMHSTTHVT